MSKRVPAFFIVDICIAVNKINYYTSSYQNAQEFLHSELQWDATLRELQLIGEAVNTLIKMEVLDNQFRRIVDFRNQIIHAYFGIDEEIVWAVVSQKLPQLLDELNPLLSGEGFIRATNAAIKENGHNKRVLNYLQSLL